MEGLVRGRGVCGGMEMCGVLVRVLRGWSANCSRRAVKIVAGSVCRTALVITGFDERNR